MQGIIDYSLYFYKLKENVNKSELSKMSDPGVFNMSYDKKY